MRKVEPLERALSEVDAWITGLRRDQSPTRAGTPKLGWDDRHPASVKAAPLADWSEKDVWRYIAEQRRALQPAARPRATSRSAARTAPSRAGAATAAGPAPTRSSAACTAARRLSCDGSRASSSSASGSGILVGTTGMGGGSLMTPLLILVFGIKPVVAVGTDLAYAAVTKTRRRLAPLPQRARCSCGMALWLAVGSCPGALGGRVACSTRLRDASATDFDTFMLIVDRRRAAAHRRR